MEVLRHMAKFEPAPLEGRVCSDPDDDKFVAYGFERCLAAPKLGRRSHPHDVASCSSCGLSG